MAENKLVMSHLAERSYLYNLKYLENYESSIDKLAFIEQTKKVIAYLKRMSLKKEETAENVNQKIPVAKHIYIYFLVTENVIEVLLFFNNSLDLQKIESAIRPGRE